MNSVFRSLILAALMLVTTACTDTFPTSTAMDQETDSRNSAQEIVDRSRTTVEAISVDKDFVGVRDMMQKAKGVLVFPKLVKGAFLVGGEGGTGLVMIRQADGSFGYPAFYNMVGGSVGLQIGVESTETLFLIMTQKGLDSIIQNQFKLGADVSVALGPIGAGLGAGKSSVDLASDLYVYSKASGLFGGGAFKGAIITIRPDLNKSYYQTEANAADILRTGQYSNSGADALRAALALQPSPNTKSVPITPVEQY